jgi:hypothetical protein
LNPRVRLLGFQRGVRTPLAEHLGDEFPDIVNHGGSSGYAAGGAVEISANSCVTAAVSTRSLSKWMRSQPFVIVRSTRRRSARHIGAAVRAAHRHATLTRDLANNSTSRRRAKGSALEPERGRSPWRVIGFLDAKVRKTTWASCGFARLRSEPLDPPCTGIPSLGNATDGL